ncbi:hypothetical protein TrVE_jg5836 [Triparma verrucosa]|uniref:Uncharacterized protein n=1 Tax=Triparma verrucosa TaxID=1606542 RepID=A0A9W7BVZ6_9STRA|nr:hypothetical protein TrVE_jg5836 [Triparma verrucosa]
MQSMQSMQSTVQSQADPQGDQSNQTMQVMMMLVQSQSMMLQNQQAEIRELKESIKAIADKRKQQNTQINSVWSDNDRIRIQANLDTHPLKKDIMLKPAFKGGKQCEYMSGHTVNAHMNEVFGFNGWNTEVFNEDSNIISKPGPDSGNFHVSVTVNCKVILADGSFHVDTGTGDGQQLNLHAAMDTARKGAFTDAMKRACKKFGNYMGLSLYVGGSKESAKKTAYSTKGERDTAVEARAQEGRDVLAVTEQQQHTMQASRPTSSSGDAENRGSLANVKKESDGLPQMNSSNAPAVSVPPKPAPGPHPQAPASAGGIKRSGPVTNPYASSKKPKA